MYTNDAILIRRILEYCKNRRDTLEEGQYKTKRVSLNRPMRGDRSRYKVYIRNPKTGNITKIEFGNPKKRSDINRTKVKCKQRKNKSSAGYWSCRT